MCLRFGMNVATACQSLNFASLLWWINMYIMRQILQHMRDLDFAYNWESCGCVLQNKKNLRKNLQLARNFKTEFKSFMIPALSERETLNVAIITCFFKRVRAILFKRVFQESESNRHYLQVTIAILNFKTIKGKGVLDTAYPQFFLCEAKRT